MSAEPLDSVPDGTAMRSAPGGGSKALRPGDGSAGPAIALVGVTKRYREATALERFSLEIRDGEFLVLLGPSGCGKSTLLKLIAGLEDATEGEIYIGGRLANYVPAKARDVAMVFQNYALYPHMTVEDNLAFPLKMRGAPRETIRERVVQVAQLLGLERHLPRHPEQLSGGQRQRVALGRAIIRNPAAFLMDEPLSNLDALLRVQMRDELLKLHRRVGRTTVYVTHDQVEAMTMADRIVVMNAGLIQQVGSPIDVYDRPANTFVATFVGSPQMNLYSGRVARGDRGADFVAAGLRVPLGRFADEMSGVTLGIRPEDVTLSEDSRGAIRGAIVLIEPVGADMYLNVALDAGQTCVLRTPRTSSVEEGNRVALGFRSDRLHLFDANGARLGDAAPSGGARSTP
jgi:multiple sugar transport system ATP-binding protein